MLIYLDYSDLLDETDPNTPQVKSLITTERLFYIIAIAISESQLEATAFENVIKTVLYYSDLKDLDKDRATDIVYEYIRNRMFGTGGLKVSLELLNDLKDLTQCRFKVIPTVQGVYFAYKSN